MNKQTTLIGAAGRPFALDATYQETRQAKPVIIFAHGFKGFKDWGHWGAIAQAFSEAGFVFIKFNFSHNGVTIDQPLDFADLEAFGQNNYMKEVVDFGVVMDWLFEQNIVPSGEIDLNNITAVGHSRGGPIALFKAFRDKRISSLITWASVHRLDSWMDEERIKHWREKGVMHTLNGRTKQQMPLYFQLYENFKENEDWLNTEQVLTIFDKPMLILQGSDDPAVSTASAQQLQAWKKDAVLHIIEGANHVFGGSHPFSADKLPPHSQELIEHCIGFLKRQI